MGATYCLATEILPAFIDGLLGSLIGGLFIGTMILLRTR